MSLRNMDQSKFEENPNNGIETLSARIKDKSIELREFGCPLNEDGRINMAAFEGFYPPDEIKRDQEKVLEREKKFKKDDESVKDKKIGQGRNVAFSKEGFNPKENRGEQLEIIVTYVFQQLFNERFLVARSSRYDDVFNGVDHLILDRETGNPVCAFDEIASVSGPLITEKQERILRRNQEGGVALKYGLDLKPSRTGLPEIQLSQLKNLPIFCFSFPSDEIRRAVQELSSTQEIGSYHGQLEKYFHRLIQYQISSLRLKTLKSPELQKRLNLFEQTLEELQLPK